MYWGKIAVVAANKKLTTLIICKEVLQIDKKNKQLSRKMSQKILISNSKKEKRNPNGKHTCLKLLQLTSGQGSTN